MLSTKPERPLDWNDNDLLYSEVLGASQSYDEPSHARQQPQFTFDSDGRNTKKVDVPTTDNAKKKMCLKETFQTGYFWWGIFERYFYATS